MKTVQPIVCNLHLFTCMCARQTLNFFFLSQSYDFICLLKLISGLMLMHIVNSGKTRKKKTLLPQCSPFKHSIFPNEDNE